MLMRMPGGKGQNGQEYRKLGIKEKQPVLLSLESFFLTPEKHKAASGLFNNTLLNKVHILKLLKAFFKKISFSVCTTMCTCVSLEARTGSQIPWCWSLGICELPHEGVRAKYQTLRDQSRKPSL